MRVFTHFLSDATSEKLEAKARESGLDPSELIAFTVEMFLSAIGSKPLAAEVIQAARFKPEPLKSFTETVMAEVGEAVPEWMKE